MFTPTPLRNTLDAIGSTPLVRLARLPDPDAAAVYVKLESFNPTGSYKDRMAKSMIEEAERRGELEPGMTVVEYTGGSTGSSLAFVCAVKGYRFLVVSSDAFAREKLDTMRAFGAELVLVPSEGGKITPDLIPRMIERARELADQPGVYWTDQFNNRDALVGYRSVGEELAIQLETGLDVFCAAVGVSGLAMGTSAALTESGLDTRVVILEPAESAVLSGEQAGSHRVEGVGIGFRPPLLDDRLYQDVRAIPEERARRTARLLAREEGVFSGISTGLNVAAALDLAGEYGPGKVVATVAVDSGLKYLSGGLFGEEAS